MLHNQFEALGLKPYGAVPSRRQMDWYRREATAFFHFGVKRSPLQNRFILQRASCFTLYVQEFHNDFLLDPATVDPQPGVCGGRQLFIVIGNHIRDSPALAV